MDIDDDTTWHDRRMNRMRTNKTRQFRRYVELHQMDARAKVRALYPLLKEGISVQDITAVTDEAARWESIPEAFAEQYAEWYVECAETFDRMRYMLSIEEWIDIELDNLKSLEEIRAVNEP